MELRGRSVLVTGPAGGLGMARRLRAEGCTLTLTGRQIMRKLAEGHR